MKAISSAIVAAVFMALLALLAGAQNRGVIAGQILNPDGTPATGVRVGARAADQSGVEALAGLAVTDAEGRYRLEDLPLGRYYVFAGPLASPVYHPGTGTPEGATIATVAGAPLNGFNFIVDYARLGLDPSALLRILISHSAASLGPCFVGVPPTRPGILLLAADRKGNVFFADENASSVSRLTPDGKVTTIAGKGTTGFSGDGGAATAASLGPVRALAADSSGNLFIAEGGSPRVRKVTPAGVITTVAGNGTLGVSGDGGPATAAAMCTPIGLALDGAGNLFIATGMGKSPFNNARVHDDYRVRKVDNTGIIRTVAGNGEGGDGAVAELDPRTRQSTYSAPNGVSATAAPISPVNIAADASGNLYIVIPGEMIRKVSPDGAITTVAGSGSPSSTTAVADGIPALSARVTANNADMAVDAMGNLFVTQEARIRKIDSTGIVATIAGNGEFSMDDRDGIPALDSALNVRSVSSSLWNALASSMASDGAGNLFIGESQDFAGEIIRRIRKITPDGRIFTVFNHVIYRPCADPQLAISGRVSRLFLATDRAGNVFFADERANLVRKLTPQGTVTTVAGNGERGFRGDGGPATSASLGAMNALAADPAGNLYIAEIDPPRVRKVNLAGTIVTVAGNGKREVGGDGGPATSASLCVPTGLATDAVGNLFIASGAGPVGANFILDNYRIRKVDAAGVITTVAGVGMPQGNFLVDPRATQWRMWARSIAADAAGNLYVLGESGITRVSPDGVTATLARRDNSGRSPAISTSADLAVDSTGNLLIADAVSSRIQKLGMDGRIVTVAGNNERALGFGEGTMATASSLSLFVSPVATGSAIAADAAGNLFIGESDGNGALTRIRKVTPDGAISTVFSSAPFSKISGQVVSTVSPSAWATRAFGGDPVPVSGAPTAALYLIPLDDSGSPLPRRTPERVSLDAPALGRFGLSIPTGSYELFGVIPDINGWDLAAPGRGGGANPVTFGRTRFQMGGDPANITVNVHPGVDLKGRVTADGQPVSPKGLRIRLRPDAVAATFASYQAVGRFSPVIGADGSFTFPALPEALYHVELQWTTAPSHALHEILLDGKDVFETGFTIGTAAPGVLEITLKPLEGAAAGR